MVRKKSTNISLIILAVVALVAVSYFAWIFLAPPPASFVEKTALPTEVQAGIVSDSVFRSLRPFAELPIIATKVGRINPFLPVISEADAKKDAEQKGEKSEDVNNASPKNVNSSGEPAAPPAQ
jgi:flagellar basal body-associated protein FliL